MVPEFENAPDCCKKTIKTINNRLEAAKVLTVFLAAAPNIVKLRPRITPLGILGALGSGTWSTWKRTPGVKSVVNKIVCTSIRQDCDFEILEHSQENNYDLVKHWTNIRREFEGV